MNSSLNCTKALECSCKEVANFLINKLCLLPCGSFEAFFTIGLKMKIPETSFPLFVGFIDSFHNLVYPLDELNQLICNGSDALFRRDSFPIVGSGCLSIRGLNNGLGVSSSVSYWIVVAEGNKYVVVASLALQ